MKIGITGHSRGIGKDLFDLYANEHEVIGFSRSNGFDISIEDTRIKILEICKDFDIFINNAWDIYGQNNLLKKFIEAWHEKENKTIINIGSKIAFINYKHPYATSKKELLKTVRTRILEPYPRILNIASGVVDTEMGRQIDTKIRLSSKNCAEFIKLVASFTSPVCVQEIVFSDPNEHFSL